MSSAEEHFKKVLEAKHHVASALDGGACIQGDCKENYKPNDSCSYRWQVVKAYGAENGHPLGRHNYYVTPTVTRPVATDRYETASSQQARAADPNLDEVFYPAKYPASLPIPGEGDWDIGGPSKKLEIKDDDDNVICTIRKGKNFHTWTAPWWNNAHHLIPKATLRNRIADVPDPPPEQWAGPIGLNEVIKRFLLYEKYNVNHYRNMLILPMDSEVGRVIGLPRHLVLADAPAKLETGDTKTFADHQAYGQLVLTKLEPIIREFVKAGMKAGKACVTQEVKASKEKLEKLSDRCYKAVTTGLPAGEPISLLKDIPELPKPPPAVPA